MNCQHIRAAIDAASPREPFSEQVAFHLAGCQSCQDYAAQMTALFALMMDAPRVQVPNDFDFRLRARIAQAKSTPAPRGGLSFFSEFWKQSFSWGQTASALAAVALVVTLSTVYLTRDNSSVATVEPKQVAENIAPTPTFPSVNNTEAGSKMVAQIPDVRTNLTVTEASQPKAVRVSNRTNSASRTERPMTAFQPAAPARPEVLDERSDTVATHQILIRNSGRSHLVSVRDVSYGVPPTVMAVNNTQRPVQAVF